MKKANKKTKLITSETI